MEYVWLEPAPDLIDPNGSLVEIYKNLGAGAVFHGLLGALCNCTYIYSPESLAVSETLGREPWKEGWPGPGQAGCLPATWG